MMRIKALCTAAVFLFLAGWARSEEASAAVAESSATVAAAAKPEKRFWRAAGEMIVVGYAPWVWSHYVKDYDYADISMDTVRRNFEEGFTYDQDSFQTNQWGHPFQGSLYYNAGRVNGFNFWESSIFTLAGDFGWEFFMESERPSYNDMVNTWFGGISRGEITYRMSSIILDNRATGSERFWREFGAGVLNPVRFIDRAVFGDMWKKQDNPVDRFPSRLFVMVDGAYRHGREDTPSQDYATLDLLVRQNDMHDMEVKKPFDYFDLEGTLSFSKHSTLFPRVAYRGMLADWEISDQADSHHVLAPVLAFNLYNNTRDAFGGQGLDFLLFSRWNLPSEFELRTEVGGTSYIFAAIQNDYNDPSMAATGRNYDFASGGGPKFDLRIRREKVDWLRCTVAAGWFGTNDGISKESRIFLVNTEARYPLAKDLYGGLGWSFQDRHTLYDELPEATKTNSEFKVFLSYAFRVIG